MRGIQPIRFENESDDRFDSRFDSNEKTIRRSLSKDPTNSIKSLKEKAVKENYPKNTNYTYAYTHKKQHTNEAYTNKHSKSPSLQLYGVTRGWLSQR